jgi:hypothetical protein
MYDKTTNNWTTFDLAKHFPYVGPQFIASMYLDRAGTMMFASDAGLITLSERENKWTLVTDQDSEIFGGDASCILKTKTEESG